MRGSRLCLSVGSSVLVAVLVACATGTGADTPGEPDRNAPALPVPTTANPVGPDSDGSAPDGGDKTPEAGAADTSTPDGAATGCTGYAAPTVSAGCKCAAGKVCTANNCFGGYYCELTTTPPKCVPKPASCP